MSEIKKYYKTGCGSSFCDLVEHKDGNYVLYEDHLKAIAEAKKEGVRKFLEKVKLTCFSRYSRMIKPSCKTCDYNFICNQTPKNWNDEDIKKVEGI